MDHETQYRFKRTPQFIRSYKKVKNPHARKAIKRTLVKLATNPYHPSLRTSKLVKSQSEMYSRVNDDYRLVWQFDEGEEHIIVLLNVGPHRIVE